MTIRTRQATRAMESGADQRSCRNQPRDGVSVGQCKQASWRIAAEESAPQEVKKEALRQGGTAWHDTQ